MKTRDYRLLELFLIFIIAPISFVLQFPIWIKIAIGVLGFGYVIFVLLKIEGNVFKIKKGISWRQFRKRTLLKFVGVFGITTAYVLVVDANNLFSMPLNKPFVWVIIIFVYSAFSVYPQELIYRTFFFQRYQSLFKNKTLFILCNAAVFSLAHIFFKNTLVLFLTFIGGIIFALTYKKTKSTLLVSIEHAIYGCWLFTVGMGEMLGFPN
ncbi:CPBP family intramembrane glutamic endopeptidase [Winogradskyella sp. UBA3174]|uniref:CPBP family intramembrane glutamic endopeptidase n=1 Tax=Winogradskyella sp. UBA3174 TaxID=1947785 RepID=UPI0025DC1D72|nr:CPBP family intramembrane glutamic endopeptidase [Winogradskyella sp. UBA3174]|tara:strand:+ start:2351 stop:2977 length:627 start_codon:yes stop_codon:yes gene_type:complete